MADFVLPVLGLGDEQMSPVTVTWRDGTVICRGILGDMSSETLARQRAEQLRQEELRQQTNVVLLEDWRQND
jgi:hypothetical protein